MTRCHIFKALLAFVRDHDLAANAANVDASNDGLNDLLDALPILTATTTCIRQFR